MIEEIIKEKTTELNSIPKASQSIEDSIKVLEDKINKHSNPNAENYNWIAYEILLLQLNQLKKLKEEYDKFSEDDLLTIQTKESLQKLFWQLHETVKSWKQINNDLALIWNEIKKEKSLKEDTNIWKMNVSDVIDFEAIWKVWLKEFYKNHVEFKKFFDPTIRDYVEKHIKFDGNFITWKLNNIRETDFMTYFYDTFTVKYLDYLHTSNDKWTLELMHMNLDARNWLVINEEQIDDLLKKTLNNMLERWIKPDEWIISIKIVSKWKVIERDILEIALEEIKKVTDHKVLVIKYNLEALDVKSSYSDFKKSVSLVKKLDSYVKNIIPVENRDGAEILVNTIKKSLKEKTISILKEKHKDIENITNSLENSESWEVTKKVLWFKIEELENIYNIINNNIDKITKEEFDIESKKKAIKVNFEIKIQELEKKEFKESISKEINEIKKLIDSIEIDNIWNTLRQINEKDIQVKKMLNKTHILWYDEKSIYDKEFNEINEKMVDKLLYTYLNDLWKKTIVHRWDISDSNLFYKLTNSLNSWDITKKLMWEIVEQGYYYAFINELRWSNWDKILKRLRSNENIWKNEFRKELSWLIKDRETAESFFLLSFIESNASPFAESEKWAKWYFQMLPATADNHWMKTEADLRKPKKSAELAASYLWELMQSDRWKKEEVMISNALLRYNWQWSTRLNREYTKEIKSTILEITRTLYLCKSQLTIGQITEKEALDMIIKVHNKYFDIEKVKKWEFHFSILDDNANWIIINKDSILLWIDNYAKDILNQQYMYPQQLKAAGRAYEFHKNKKG